MISSRYSSGRGVVRRVSSLCRIIAPFSAINTKSCAMGDNLSVMLWYCLPLAATTSTFLAFSLAYSSKKRELTSCLEFKSVPSISVTTMRTRLKSIIFNLSTKVFFKCNLVGPTQTVLSINIQACAGFNVI